MQPDIRNAYTKWDGTCPISEYNPSRLYQGLINLLWKGLACCLFWSYSLPAQEPAFPGAGWAIWPLQINEVFATALRAFPFLLQQRHRSHRCWRGEAPIFSVVKLILGQISSVFTDLTQQKKSNQCLFPLGFHRSCLCGFVQLLAALRPVYKILDFMDILAASSPLISHLSPTQLFVITKD